VDKGHCVCKYVRVRSLQFVCTGHNMLIGFICVILNICVRCCVLVRMCFTVHNTVCVLLYTTLCVFYCTQHCVCFTVHNTVCVVLYTTLCVFYCTQHCVCFTAHNTVCAVLYTTLCVLYCTQHCVCCTVYVCHTVSLLCSYQYDCITTGYTYHPVIRCLILYTFMYLYTLLLYEIKTPLYMYVHNTISAY
jgi:hypothetical protein